MISFFLNIMQRVNSVRRDCLRFAANRSRRITLALLGGLFLATPLVTHASVASIVGNTIGAFTVNAIGFVAYIFNLLIGGIAAILFTVGGYFINVGFTLNNVVMTSRLLRVGFQISLQTTNLGFVLAIIMIAFATIIRYEAYGLKKMLGKLIIAAFLINFSLTIAGVLLDFSGVLTNYFIGRSVPGQGLNIPRFVDALAGSFNPQTVLQANGPDSPSFAEVSIGTVAGILRAVTSVFFTAAFTLIGAIVLIGIGIMIFIRYVVILILLILMPFAWLGYVMPGLESWWHRWWSSFLKWTLFLPATTFFFYLTIVSVDALRNEVNTVNVGADIDLFTGNLQEFGNMIATLGLLIASLVVGQKIGIKGASGAMGVMKGIGQGFTGKINLKKKAEETTKKLTEKAAKLPVARQLLRPLAPFSKPLREGYRAGREERAAKGAEEVSEQMQKSGPDQMNYGELQELAASGGLRGNVDRFGKKFGWKEDNFLKRGILWKRRRAGAIRVLAGLARGEGLPETSAQRKAREEAPITFAAPGPAPGATTGPGGTRAPFTITLTSAAEDRVRAYEKYRAKQATKKTEGKKKEGGSDKERIEDLEDELKKLKDKEEEKEH